jgi:DNA invertase Pin-like site-specific DNA recombinase
MSRPTAECFSIVRKSPPPFPTQGDLVIFAEISRMARSTLQVLEMLECCMRRGISVHIAKQQMILDGSMPSRIAATVLGLAAEIEREFISLRTTEALAKRKAEGKPLGRPKGRKSTSLKLDASEALIQIYLAKGISKRSIAKLLDCSPSTLYDWLERKGIRAKKSALSGQK